MKRILVTGATGFIGNYVIPQLLQRNCDVIATSVQEAKARQCSWFPKVTYVPFNLEQFDPAVDYYEFFGRPDAMIHLAWEGLPNYKAAFHTEVNLPRHRALLQNLVAHGLPDLTVTGTCFEYGMQEGPLQEDMPVYPHNPYARAKDELRKYLQELQQQHPYLLKWVRLFYMYGRGQSPNSLLSQLEAALAKNEPVFNMSGGEQVRDFLPVEKVAANIVSIALQSAVTGVINCCSGQPVTVKQFVEDYLKKHHATISLNLGYYPYPDYEPMRFWGDVTKLKKVHMDPIQAFIDERSQRIQQNSTNESLINAANNFNVESNKAQYSYNFSWMGRPIIQYPQDMIAMQEIIWEVKPDLIIETGIAHGGSLIYYASLLELIGHGEVLGIDIDIRTHNRTEIEKHPMFKRIAMLEGSAVSQEIVEQVRKIAAGKERVMVCLDSNHTHEHVLQELELYAPFVTKGSYLVVFDTIVEFMPNDYLPGGRPWNKGNNPQTAVDAFLRINDSFQIQKEIDNKLLISVAPNGYLKRIK